MRRKTFFSFILYTIVTVFIFLTGCSQPQHKTAERTVQDMLGRTVHVPDTIRNVVGLRAGALRLLVYMDAANLISGIEDIEKQYKRPYNMAHPEFDTLPVIGPAMGGDPELIAMNNPDVLFLTYTTRSDADELQRITGIPVVALKCGNLREKRDTLYKSLRLIGNVLHKERRADTLISFINHQITQLKTRSMHHQGAKPTVYIGGVAYSGSHGITSTEPFYAPFGFLEARNVASGINNKLISPIKGTYIDVEQLIEWDPNYIFIDVSGLELITPDIKKGSPLSSVLSALKNGQVYTVMPYNSYATNYEIVLANAWFIGKTIYPDAFKNIDIKQKTGMIYRTFAGKNVSNQLEHQYGKNRKL